MFFIVTVTAPHMAQLYIWLLIALYPKHIQFGEERIQFILATYTTRVVTKMAKLIICFVWFYNVVKHCNRTDFVLKLLLGNTFEIYRPIT